MIKRIQGLIAGILIGVVISGSVVFAAQGTEYINVLFDKIRVFVDGQEVVSDAEPLIYNDRTYVPIRAVVEKLGDWVFWDDNSKSVKIIDANKSKIQEMKNAFNLYSNVGFVKMDCYRIFNNISDMISAEGNADTYRILNTSFEVTRDSFLKYKQSDIDFANEVINTSSNSINIECAKKFIDTCNDLERMINLGEELLAIGGSDKYKIFTDNFININNKFTEIETETYKTNNQLSR